MKLQGKTMRNVLTVVTLVTATLFIVPSAIAGVVPGPAMGDNWAGIAAIAVVGIGYVVIRQIRQKRGT